MSLEHGITSINAENQDPSKAKLYSVMSRVVLIGSMNQFYENSDYRPSSDTGRPDQDGRDGHEGDDGDSQAWLLKPDLTPSGGASVSL
jgi:hypothetical protein